MRVKLKPCKGKYVHKKNSNEINSFLRSALTPDRSEMYKEADEFAKKLRVYRRKNGL